MEIVQIAAEAYPWQKVGGLADVVGALVKHMSRQGHRVHLFLPYVPGLTMNPASSPQTYSVRIRLGPLRIRGRICTWRLGARMDLHFVDLPRFFHRPGLYQPGGGGGYADNLQRFGAFCRMVLRGLERLQIQPAILHAHDWHAAQVPILVRWHRAWSQSHLRHVGRVFTIHNLAFQGRFPARFWWYLGLPVRYFTEAYVQHRGRINLVKGAVLAADRVTTVSPRYACEIQTHAFGEGLEALFRDHAGKLVGIRNGIDTEIWDPAHDPHLPANFDAEHIEQKERCKRALLDEVGLEGSRSTPLVGVVARLTRQKGLDVLADAVPGLVETGFRMVILGTGEPQLEAALAARHRAYPAYVAFCNRFDEGLAHRIFAGSDLFLMPSRFEPCGLSQMYAMRYGAVPVAHAVGGLWDTIRDIRDDPEAGTGFLFTELTVDAMLEACRAAQSFYRRVKVWHTLVRRCMLQDFGWHRTIQQYLNLYQQIVRR